MSKAITITDFVRAKSAPHGWITPEAIRRARDTTKMGDIISVKSAKGYVCMDGNMRAEAMDRRGTVLSKHRHLCVLKYPGGLTEAFQWAQIAMIKRGKG